MDEYSSKLDLTSLRSSISSLKDSIDTYIEFSSRTDISKRDMNTIRSGVIQNFEVAYELCWKFMKRWLDANIGSGTADGVTKKELFRISAENRLIGNAAPWIEFHHSRNLTSHTYDGSNAETVLASALVFFPAAADFLARLEERND